MQPSSHRVNRPNSERTTLRWGQVWGLCLSMTISARGKDGVSISSAVYVVSVLIARIPGLVCRFMYLSYQYRQQYKVYVFWAIWRTVSKLLFR